MLQQQTWKHFAKKQTTLEAVAYLGFPAPGDKFSVGLPPSPFVAAWNKRNTTISLQVELLKTQVAAEGAVGQGSVKVFNWNSNL